MDLAAYHIEAELEQSHWWFRGRRALFSRQINALGLPHDARILDVGTSTGTNLRMLRTMGREGVTGLESNPVAIEFCARKGFKDVQLGDICNMPFDDDSFDLVLATDVIEHVDDDVTAVAELFRVLKPGGHLIVTVPCFMLLWGRHDVQSHHRRRYRVGALIELLRGAGFCVLNRFHFNVLLFLPILVARRIILLSGAKVRNENTIGTPFINLVLTGIFSVDCWLAPYLRAPFGVSAFALVRKPA